MDGTTDRYSVTVRTKRTLPVEKILAVVEEETTQPVFQEELTKRLARRLRASVITHGTHSGVRTRCAAG